MVEGQFGINDMPKKPKPAPLKEDLKYIKCETCNHMVKEAMRRTAEISSTSAVEDMLDKVCDADADVAEQRATQWRLRMICCTGS